MGTILAGTSSWSDHDPFYPPGTKPAEQLPYYAHHFPVVEVNTTYYRIPSLKMVKGWADRTPDDFVFDVKPPRELTSTPEAPRGEAPEPDADLASAFLDAIGPLLDDHEGVPLGIVAPGAHDLHEPPDIGLNGARIVGVEQVVRAVDDDPLAARPASWRSASKAPPIVSFRG